MKKLMMALAVVGLAFGSQAATFTWKSSANAQAINVAGVTDNGSYAAGGVNMKNNGTWSYVLSIFDASTGDLVGSASGSSIKFSTTGSKFNTGIEVSSDAIVANTEYTYSIVINGTMDALTGRGVDGDFDYSAATLTTTISGSITTAGMGATTLTTATPSAWTVSGITAVAVPEPTSGLLMLVGLAGLALRRRRA